MAVGLSDKNRHAKKEWTPQVESLLPEQKVLARRHLRYELKQLGVVAERSEVAVFVLRHHTRMIANQDGSVYSTRCSAANAVYREDQMAETFEAYRTRVLSYLGD